MRCFISLRFRSTFMICIWGHVRPPRMDFSMLGPLVENIGATNGDFEQDVSPSFEVVEVVVSSFEVMEHFVIILGSFWTTLMT